ncbi:class I SAM-dependent methyltransferase [Aliidiomarina soli]|uniref:SAM-dependent methyltransferase n=1 Tax=Aliidiomarina soli TaxID=1928574 RepID=A0A432WLM0_9GAMM|nr:class I SAM-dependent methyltransferase [Aliidiomarina soli]RUO34712.1 SAM-dependent methyltransferase [Aliidiomarina soli]
MKNKDHWEDVYSTKAADEVSWFQPQAERSLALIHACVCEGPRRIIDIGGGASRLVDDLIEDADNQITVLDLSSAALRTAQARLSKSGEPAQAIEWVEADVLDIDLTTLKGAPFDIWHDRAVFHFLTNASDRVRYVEQLKSALKPGGWLIIATFADDGPSKCSGLPVERYDADKLAQVFAEGFTLLQQQRETHLTPAGAEQKFIYCVFKRD